MYKERCLKAESELTAAQERIQQLEGKLREAEKKEDENDQEEEEEADTVQMEPEKLDIHGENRLIYGF